MNFFHVSLSHTYETVLRATSVQESITLTGHLAPCAGWWKEKADVQLFDARVFEWLQSSVSYTVASWDLMNAP